MHPLYQRLRELDPDTFQRFCGQLLSAKHPGVEIRHVEGAGGDRGLDIFLGELDDNPTIWQCKCFANGLGPKQRPQVTESLRTATRHFRPNSWILVIPVDLDAKAHAWYQKLKKANAGKVALGLFQASDIVRELIHRRDLRDAFFPNAVLDTITVSRAIRGIGGADAMELERLAVENFDELIARLEKEDARFTYQIVYGPNAGPDIAKQVPRDPLLIASVGDNKKRIDVFARDLDAIKLDPPSVKFTMSESGFRKLGEFLRTGREQALGPGEVTSLRSTFDFLVPGKDLSNWGVVLKPPRGMEARRVKLRLTFSRGEQVLRYDFVEFRIVRIGTDEAEMESISKLPFTLSIRLPLKPSLDAEFSVIEKYKGREVRDVLKALRALAMLREGALLELHDLEQEKSLGRLNISAPSTPKREGLEAFVRDASAIAEKFGISLHLPERIGRNDFQQVAFFKALIDGSALPIDDFSGSLVKRMPHSPSVETLTAGFLDILATFERLSPAPRILGIAVDTGPVMLRARNARIVAPDDFWERFTRARVGDVVPFTVKAAEMRAALGEGGEYGFFIRPDLDGSE